MKAKKTTYDSLEKDYLRKNCWIEILKKSLIGKDKIKILEMIGDTSKVWWYKLAHKYQSISFEVNGITMGNSGENKKEYLNIYIGRYDKLLADNIFIKSFPYDFINLDYYGGGRWFNKKYQYDKMPDIYQTIKNNLELTDNFYLILTIDTNDKIYPWFKSRDDIITNSPIKLSIEKFLNNLKNVDQWNLWLAIIGNCLAISRIGESLDANCALVYPPYTYVGESTGHKSRMIFFSFQISKGKKNIHQNDKGIFEITKKTRFLKWLKNTEKVVIKNPY